MAAYKVFFPIVRQPKGALTGDSKCRVETTTASKPTTYGPKWIGPEPIYKAEIEVTRALALGQFKPCDAALTTDEAYKQAKAWEKYQKDLAKPRFFRKNTATANRNGVYSHCLFPSHGK